jgi:hypothetical protein
VSDENLQILSRILRLYEDLAVERNKIAHNPIGRTPDENALYIMLRRKSPPVGELPYETAPISIEAIDRISARIKKFNLILIALSHRLAGIPTSASRDALLADFALSK